MAKDARTNTSSAPVIDSTRIHRLLRSLVGVADVSLIVTPEGKLRSVAVLRDGNVQEHQLVRNVVSGLKAGFGLRLEPSDVQVILHADVWRQRAAEAERRTAEPTKTLPAAPTVTSAPTPAWRHVVTSAPNGSALAATNGNGKHSNGNGNGIGASRHRDTGIARGNGRLYPVPVQFAPLDSGPTQPRTVSAVTESTRVSSTDQLEPQLDAIEIERRGAALRCRVSVRLGEHTYSAVAEVRDAPTAEAELVARVTLDALRAGGLTTARLDGVALTTICDVVYVVAALRTAAAAVPRAGAAPLLRDIPNAAALAVLRAHGPVGIVEPRAALNGTI